MGSGKKKSLDLDCGTLRANICGEAQRLWDGCVSRPPPSTAGELWSEHLQIREVLKVIADLHAQLSDVDSLISGDHQRSKASVEKFNIWCKDHGVSTNGIRLSRCEDGTLGLGLVTNKKIEQGEVVVEVPRKAMLSLDHARKSIFLKKAFEKDIIVQSMDNVGLALSVCCQRLASDSAWKPYLNVFPASFTTPLCYSLEEMKALRPSPVYEEALLLFRSVVRQYVYFLLMVAKNAEFDKAKTGGSTPLLYNTPFTIDNFSFSLYRWSVCCVATRVNMIPSAQLTLPNGEPKMIPALIPLLDMANHTSENPDSQSVSFEAESDCAQIASCVSLSPSQQFLIYYGKRTNSDFLLHNGFVPDAVNESNSYRLKLGLNKSEKHFPSRLERIRLLGFPLAAQTNVFVFDLKNEKIPFDEKLMEFVKIHVSEEPTDDVINSPENTKKACKWLHTRLSLLLSSYSKDCVISDSSDPLISSHISRLHQSEKGILTNTIDYVSKL